MSTDAKRIQTDDIHASNLASNTPATLSHTVTPDLTAALRNIGMRTRKSVLEGYALNPNPQYGTPSSRMKAMSTGTLFQSSHNAMLVVRGDQQKTFMSPRKRHRSASPIDNGADDETCNEEESMSLDARQHPERPVKPLMKTKRAFLQSKSLPADALFPVQNQLIPQNSVHSTDEEEDWSSNLALQAPVSTFEPMSMS
ncbi:hypothetical protein J3R30DRAFT_2850560 [Lentinula aciculospora]|uniref:Uncharacterized protein n=1 Tax=Lentinula aciculospora TaxID=153920 RepID=A0A9W9DNK0_9AGAR|nr:hypothetical protein J3R30DRAFT_2850560 [Lentinula aciculospora]